VSSFLISNIISNSDRRVRQAELQARNEELQAELASLARFDKELKAIEAAIKQRKESMDQADLDIQKATHEIGNLEKEKGTAKSHIQALEKQNEWIEEEKQYVLLFFYLSFQSFGLDTAWMMLTWRYVQSLWEARWDVRLFG
jgi:septal ring factor EnvC (AmiA/AmiB activator)